MSKEIKKVITAKELFDKMLIEIVNYDYKTAGCPCVSLHYSEYWAVTWRNPIDFSNDKQTNGSTPYEACEKALEFIKRNPSFFKQKKEE